MKRVVTVALAATALSGLLVACTNDSDDGTTDRTRTNTVTRTRTPSQSGSFTVAPATTVAPLPPGAKPARGEVDRPCPYIASTPDQGPVNVAEIEGDRIYRTTVLTQYRPVGCRFYFYASPFEAVADIIPHTFNTPTEAHNAMVRTAQAGTEVMGQPDLIPGVDGVLYRTKFFGPDGDRDWACVFAKGKVMVIVHTQRKDTSRNALYLAQAIAPKF